MATANIKIKQGELLGKSSEDYDGNLYWNFLGIPYAKPPLGDLRFKAPQPPENWEGVRDATKDGSQCYSLDMFTGLPGGSEDCLFINVYTNTIPENAHNLKPVMVWIHGGSFTSGSNKSKLYGPEFLMCEDVVIASINYRLGVLGFLGLNDPKLGVPGNAGLKDMVMALTWVKNNIQAFNGDPNNVTIIGQSAGGAAVHYLMLSPMAKGLFHKAIALSGCAKNLWARGQIGGENLASAAGHDTKDEEEILKILRNLSVKDLFKSQLKVPEAFVANMERPFGPVVEKFNSYDECFLLDEPNNLILSGKYNQVPLIMGYASREGIFFDSYPDASETKIKFEKSIPYTLNLPEGSPLSLKIASAIKDFYYGDKDPESDAAKDSYYKLQTDNFHLREIYSSAVDHSKTSDFPVYLNRFGADTDLNIYKKIVQPEAKGVCHGDDIGYLFKTIFLTPKIQPGSIEEICMKRYVKYLTSFAKTGNPNPQGAKELCPALWKPITKEAIRFLSFDENLAVGCSPENSRLAFWESIFSIIP